MKMFFKPLSYLMLILVIGSLMGCNTVEGFGKDMQQGGQELQQSAKKASD